MAGQFPAASFPTEIWDGTSPTRNSVTEKRDPDKDDYDRLVAETIAVQSTLGINGNQNSLASRVTNLEQIFDPNTGQIVDPGDTRSSIIIPAQCFYYDSIILPATSTIELGVLGATFNNPDAVEDEQTIFFGNGLPSGIDITEPLIANVHYYNINQVLLQSVVSFNLAIYYTNIGEHYNVNPNQAENFSILLAGDTMSGYHNFATPVGAFLLTNYTPGTLLNWKLTRKVVPIENVPYTDSITVTYIELLVKVNKLGKAVPGN